MLKFTVPEGQDGRPVKSCILDFLPEMKPSQADRLLRGGDVRVNGQRAKKGAVCEGDLLELYLSDDYAQFIPAPDIVFEDKNLMILNKQPGISCVPDKEDGKPTLYTIAREHMRETGEYNESSLTVPYICHRLDHFTGGLVIVAKSRGIFEQMLSAFKQRQIQKFYKCIVCGVPARSQADLHNYLLKDAKNARVQILDAPRGRAQPILTRYRTLRTVEDLSMLEVELVTGRTHQIRAHLAHVGTPILGDDKYGNRRMNKKYAVRHQALWSYKLVFHTAKNSGLEYLHERVFVTENIQFPEIFMQM